jgi:hypothetical protein
MKVEFEEIKEPRKYVFYTHQILFISILLCMYLYNFLFQLRSGPSHQIRLLHRKYKINSVAALSMLTIINLKLQNDPLACAIYLGYKIS